MKFQNRVFYEITHQCNLHCTHCCNSTRFDKELITADDIDRFQKLAASYGITDCVITGGEPTMSDNFFEIVSKVSKYGNVVVTTNGTNLDPKKYMQILQANPNITLQISLDGFSCESNDLIRGNGTFNLITKLITFLVEKGFQNQVALSCVITSKNIHEIFSLISYVKEKNLNGIHFPKLISSGRGQENWEKIAPQCDEQKQVEYEIINQMSKESEDYISLNRINHILSAYLGVVDDFECISALKVSPNGSIFPCPLSMGEENCIGNIKSLYSFDELVWNMERKKNNQFSKEYIELNCNDCEASPYCKKNFCEFCKFNLASSNLNNSEQQYQCEINRFLFLKLAEGEK